MHAEFKQLFWAKCTQMQYKYWKLCQWAYGAVDRYEIKIMRRLRGFSIESMPNGWKIWRVSIPVWGLLGLLSPIYNQIGVWPFCMICIKVSPRERNLIQNSGHREFWPIHLFCQLERRLMRNRKILTLLRIVLISLIYFVRIC